MTENELLRLMAIAETNNTIEDVFPYIAEDCIYSSDARKACENIYDFLLEPQNNRKQHNIRTYGYVAEVTKSGHDNIPVGEKCIMISFNDEWNCDQFIVVGFNLDGLICRIEAYSYSVSDVEMDVEGIGYRRTAKSAEDAIIYRLLGSGRVDFNGFLAFNDKEVYPPVFRLYHEELSKYMYYNLFEDCKKRTVNAGGYMYALAMSEALQIETGVKLFEFDAGKAINCEIPAVDSAFQKWIDDGYEYGRYLFSGFFHWHESNPKAEQEEFGTQMAVAFLFVMRVAQYRTVLDICNGLPMVSKQGI